MPRRLTVFSLPFFPLLLQNQKWWRSKKKVRGDDGDNLPSLSLICIFRILTPKNQYHARSMNAERNETCVYHIIYKDKETSRDIQVGVRLIHDLMLPSTLFLLSLQSTPTPNPKKSFNWALAYNTTQKSIHWRYLNFYQSTRPAYKHIAVIKTEHGLVFLSPTLRQNVYSTCQ